MATKIRLQRNGRKGYAFYSIVIADARAPRDGRDAKDMRSIQLLLQMQEHHVMVDLLKKLVLTIRTPILPQ